MNDELYGALKNEAVDYFKKVLQCFQHGSLENFWCGKNNIVIYKAGVYRLFKILKFLLTTETTKTWQERTICFKLPAS